MNKGVLCTMSEEKKVSFIVPAYNAEQTIRSCVKSILNMSEVPIEVLVVDDGSTDGTKDICRGISDKRLRILCQDNQGVSSARNHGIREAQGEYIVFCDADDWIDAEEMEKVIYGMEKSDELVMYSVNRGNKRIGFQQDMPIFDDGLYGREALDDLVERVLDVPLYSAWKSRIMQGSVWRYLFRREKLNSCSIYFKEHLPYAEDLCFMVEAFRRLSNIRVINKYVYFLNVNFGTASRRYRPDIWQECNDRYKEIEQIFGGRGQRKILYCHDGRACILHHLLWGNFKVAKGKIREILSDERFLDILSEIHFADRTWSEKFFDWCVLSKHPIVLWLFYLPIRIRFQCVGKIAQLLGR